MKRIIFLVIFLLSMRTGSVLAAQDEEFSSFLHGVEQDALAAGVSLESVQNALRSIDLDETVIELDRKQPEHKITFDRYYKNVVTDQRIAKGRRLALEYASPLAQLHERYGVPAGVVVSLWAIESNFGDNQGEFSVLSSLATLAYEGRRADFFRGELIEALKIMDEENIYAEQLTGSWAGAMGQSQFMPSTYRKFAIDGDGDGRRDIWNSELDVIASIAHYLSAEGWVKGQGWGTEVLGADQVPDSHVGVNTSLDLATWQSYGLRPLNANALQKGTFSASLVRPDGAGGRSFLVYDNFRSIMRWNRSTYFATSVGLLADTIADGL